MKKSFSNIVFNIFIGSGLAILFAYCLFLFFDMDSLAEIKCLTGHDWEAATCASPKTCLVCGKTEGIKKNHVWTGGNCMTESVCANCGEIGERTYEHNYNSGGICTRCGKEKEAPKVQAESESTVIDFVTVTGDDHDFWNAVTAAQGLVKDELISPSTAEFSYSPSDYVVERSGEDWIVGGYVDAQNGLGSTIRKWWIAQFRMEYAGDGRYKLTDDYVLFV